MVEKDKSQDGNRLENGLVAVVGTTSNDGRGDAGVKASDGTNSSVFDRNGEAGLKERDANGKKSRNRRYYKGCSCKEERQGLP
jgi:hypothetical protein